MLLGFLQYNELKVQFFGEVATEAFGFKVSAIFFPKAVAPSPSLTISTSFGDEAPEARIGAAWEKKSKKGTFYLARFQGTTFPKFEARIVADNKAKKISGGYHDGIYNRYIIYFSRWA